MRRILYLIIIVALAIFIILNLRERDHISEAIFTQFQNEEPRLTQTAILYFPPIARITRHESGELSQEIQRIIPEYPINLVIKDVAYEGNHSGFFIGGTITMSNPQEYRRSYGARIAESGWQTTSGALTGTQALIRELETANYQARVIFLGESFGIFILRKNE